MNRKTVYGICAENCLQELSKAETPETIACGGRIGALDYFEAKRLKLLHEFQAQDINDDVYVLTHRDELM